MSHINDAKAQSRQISGALSGSSSALQVLGNIGRDDKPEVLLAVGLAHAQHAIDALIAEVEDLRREVDGKRRGSRIF